MTVAVLLVAIGSAGAWAAETTTDTTHAKPKAKHTARAHHAKPAPANAQQMSPEKRRDLERRIEALEQKYEMQPAEQPGAH